MRCSLWLVLRRSCSSRFSICLVFESNSLRRASVSAPAVPSPPASAPACCTFFIRSRSSAACRRCTFSSRRMTSSVFAFSSAWWFALDATVPSSSSCTLFKWIKARGGTRVDECWVCADLTSENRPLGRPNFSEKVTLRETFLENFLLFSKNFLPFLDFFYKIFP